MLRGVRAMGGVYIAGRKPAVKCLFCGVLCDDQIATSGGIIVGTLLAVEVRINIFGDVRVCKRRRRRCEKECYDKIMAISLTMHEVNDF